MGTARVKRWRRQGQDRLYVADATGRGLGYLDLRDATVHNVPPQRRDDFDIAVYEWLRQHPELIPEAADDEPHTPTPIDTAAPAGATVSSTADTIEMHSSPAIELAHTGTEHTPFEAYDTTRRSEVTDRIPRARPTIPPSLAAPSAAARTVEEPLPTAPRRPRRRTTSKPTPEVIWQELPDHWQQTIEPESTAHAGRPLLGVVPNPDYSTPPPESFEGADLADREAGQAVAERAEIERSAHPIRALLERLGGVHSDTQAWRKGAAGERETAKQLRPLVTPWWSRAGSSQPRWKVLHSVPIGTRGTDIDHLLIGPRGVFTINTKNHPGKHVWVGDHAVTVNRVNVGYGCKSAAEAQRVQAVLNTQLLDYGVLVTPLVAVVGGQVSGRSRTSEGVIVTTARGIRSRVKSVPACLTAAQIDEIYDIARDAEIWR